MSRAVERAIEVFVQGFCFTRSYTHPYIGERIGPVWVMRDAPRRRGKYRGEEWVAYDAPPEDVDRIARSETRGRYAVCALSDDDAEFEALRDAYKALDYRLLRTEPLMTHDLQHIPDFEPPVPIERVTTQESADALAKAARSRQILPEHLPENNASDPPPIRQYVARADDDLVGWVGSIRAGGATWCSNMFVKPDYRRRGIARAMLSRMLHDDRESGARAAVLLASHTGAKLYPVVGYAQIGTLLILSPKKRGK